MVALELNCNNNSQVIIQLYLIEIIEEAAGFCHSQPALIHYLDIVHVLCDGGSALVRGVLHRVQEGLDYELYEVYPVRTDVQVLFEYL